jgi:hypothetical protein
MQTANHHDSRRFSALVPALTYDVDEIPTIDRPLEASLVSLLDPRDLVQSVAKRLAKAAKSRSRGTAELT